MPILNQPADYSGDTWHIAAALALNPALRLVISFTYPKGTKPIPKTPTGGKEAPVFAQMMAFYASMGVGRQVEVKGFVAPDGNQSLDEKVAWHQRQTKADYSVYESTTFLMAALASETDLPIAEVFASRPKADIRDLLAQAMRTRCATRERVEAVQEAIGGAGIRAGQKLLCVNMRNAGYNVQHNITEEILDEALRVAEATGFTPVLVGANAFGTADVLHVDLYRVMPQLECGRVDMCATACFWDELNRMCTVRFIGGRSGSTDIASFMGVDTLCWDNFTGNTEDPQVARLASQGPLLELVECKKVTASLQSFVQGSYEPDGALTGALYALGHQDSYERALTAASEHYKAEHAGFQAAREEFLGDCVLSVDMSQRDRWVEAQAPVSDEASAAHDPERAAFERRFIQVEARIVAIDRETQRQKRPRITQPYYPLSYDVEWLLRQRAIVVHAKADLLDQMLGYLERFADQCEALLDDQRFRAFKVTFGLQ